MAKPQEILKRRALRLTQPDTHVVFLLSLSPAEIASICNASAADGQALVEVLDSPEDHIQTRAAEIRSIMQSAGALMLSPVVLALSGETRFRGSRGPEVSDGLGFSGTIEIPVRTRAGRKPAWVLDGYDLLLAFSESENSQFAVPVCAIVADDPSVLRDQFAFLQKRCPLPSELGDKIFPKAGLVIRRTVGPRELPREVCEWLNTDRNSPFHGLIEPKDATRRTGSRFPISRRALAEAIGESLANPSGCLFPYRNVATGETDTDGLCSALVTFWSAVKSVFPEAWGKVPKQSRLMHPAGLRIMTRVMDRVLPLVKLSSQDRVPQTARELEKIKPYCRWTEGVWKELDALPWKDLGENRRDVNLVSNFLLRAYLMT